MTRDGAMKPVEKKQLVMIGIRRKGDTGFKLKMAHKQADAEKSELPLHSYSHVQTPMIAAVTA